MNPLTAALILGQFANETGTLQETKTKVAAWFLPTMTLASSLPLVPDGSVASARYIPPNTTVDVVGNAASMQTSAKRIVVASVIVGLAVGIGVGHWFGKRKK
jgi:hypothetical protein